MALINTETKLPQLTINNFPTLAAYEAAYAQGLIGTNDLSFVDEEVQVDWNQTISTASDYIKNKPTLATVATSGSYGDLSNKPTIGSGVLTITANGGPAIGTFGANDTNNKTIDITLPSLANDGLLTIQKNGTTIGTFSADDENNKTVNITMATVASTGNYSDLTGTPSLSTVATSGSYNDLSDKPTIPDAQVQTDWNATSGMASILNKPTLATVATSGSYSDLTDKPTIPDAQVQTDWNATSGMASILNKPTLATVATSGSYSDLTDKPTIPDAQVQTDWNATSGMASILNKPTLATVATSGSYSDLTDKPTIPDAQVQTDWNATSGMASILNKPTLATVATSGSYSDLTDKPNLSTVATSGSYSDLTDKPNLSTVATSGSYNDLSDKPTIPAAANAGVLTIERNNVSIGTFGANDSGNKTVNITVPVNAADVSALPASTKYGASLSLTIDSQTYVVTGQLKDQDGNNLGTAQTIDLPLETMVVNGSYNDSTKKIVLTLQSGSTVEFSVADLISGLQSEITAQNPLSADLITDGNTNKVFTSAEKLKLGSIEAGAEVNVQADWTVTDTSSDAYILHKPTLATVATSGSYDDLSNKPTIPTVNDATLTIQKNGTTIGTFTANSASGKTVNIEVPDAQVNSDWNSTSGVSQILNKPTLSTVATSGSYDDLSNKPTIPTVNDATLTIQKNGTTIGTFTANSASGKTVNIEVPAAAKTGLLTIQKNGTTIGTFNADDSNNKTVNITMATVASTGNYSDLTGTPSLSTVATSGSYDDLTNKPTLATVATSGSYDDLTGKPTIGSGVLTIQANGTTVGTFSANDSNDKLVNIDTATAIGSMTDVVISTIGDGEILKYNATSGKWVNSPDSGGARIEIRTWSNSN